MNLKRKIAALAITGAVAGGTAALLGGTAVATDFSSTASGSLSASAATIGTTISGGQVSLTNAVPGDLSQPDNAVITNNGSTPEVLSVKFGTVSDAIASFTDLYINGEDVGTLASFSGGSDAGIFTLAAGGTQNVEVQIGLSKATPSNLAGDSTTLGFTITGTASSAGTNVANGDSNTSDS